MPAQVQFSVIKTDDSDRVGKLEIPNRKAADWINFLVSPRQQVQIVLAEPCRGGLILYFQADERLYTYLDQRLNAPKEPRATKKVVMAQPLSSAIAN